METKGMSESKKLTEAKEVPNGLRKMKKATFGRGRGGEMQ